MMKRHIQRTLVILVALLLCCGVALEAQTITGSVNGTVTDPTGAVVPNAKVTATNVDTNIETPTTTNSDGIYNIPFLQIGNYKLTVDAVGVCDGDVWTVCSGDRPDREGRCEDGTVCRAAEGVR